MGYIKQFSSHDEFKLTTLEKGCVAYDGEHIHYSEPDVILYFKDRTKKEFYDIDIITRDMVEDDLDNIVSVRINCKEIGAKAFEGAINLRRAYLSDKVSVANSRMFCNCSKLSRVRMADSKITWIPSSGFSNCISLTSLGGKDSGADIEVPKCGVSGSGFSHCGFTKIDIDWNCIFNDYAFSYSYLLVDLNLGDSVHLQYANFLNATSLEYVKVPACMTSLANSEFQGCSKLSTVILPENLTKLGYWCFSGCSSLSTLDLPNGLKIIENHVFQNSGLTHLDIPASVTTIDGNAFTSCNKLTELNYAGTIEQFNSAITNLDIIPSACVITCSDGVVQR